MNTVAVIFALSLLRSPPTNPVIWIDIQALGYSDSRTETDMSFTNQPGRNNVKTEKHIAADSGGIPTFNLRIEDLGIFLSRTRVAAGYYVLPELLVGPYLALSERRDVSPSLYNAKRTDVAETDVLVGPMVQHTATLSPRLDLESTAWLTWNLYKRRKNDVDTNGQAVTSSSNSLTNNTLYIGGDLIWRVTERVHVGSGLGFTDRRSTYKLTWKSPNSKGVEVAGSGKQTVHATRVSVNVATMRLYF